MTNLRNEKEIMQAWSSADKALVSVACITYNHEKHIKDAIEGFLIQETDFPFEILIHDDASTDNTPNIVRKYVEIYPNIIKPILQTENQYSKGKRIFHIVTSLCVGDYVAICEGDDYWTSPKKLQIQFEAMEAHPECYISFHPVEKVSHGKKLGLMGMLHDERTILSTNYILNNGITFMPTCSLMIAKKSIDAIKSDNELNTFFNEWATSFFVKIHHSLHGGALYINKIMGSYTVSAAGSYTERVAKDIDFNISGIYHTNEAFERYDGITGYKFHSKIKKEQQKLFWRLLGDEQIPIDKRVDFFRKIHGKLSIYSKFKWVFLYKNGHGKHVIYHVFKSLKNNFLKRK